MEIKVKLDFDKGLEIYNEKNPEKRQKNRNDIYDNEGISKSTIQNLKIGKVPQSIINMIEFCDRNNLKIKDVLIVEKNGKKLTKIF